MWMCDRCQAINGDDAASCPKCASPRETAPYTPPVRPGTLPASPFAPPPDAAPLPDPTAPTPPRPGFGQAPPSSGRVTPLAAASGLGLILGWLLLRLLSPGRLLFIAIGVGIICLGRFIGHGADDFRRRAVATTGVVTSLDARPGDHGRMFYPVIQFTPQSGAPVEFTANEGSSPPSYHVGDHAPVLYDPQTPQDARLNSFWFAHAAQVMEGFGCLLIVLPLLGTPTRTAR